MCDILLGKPAILDQYVGNYVAQIVEIQNTTKNNNFDEFIVRHFLTYT